MTILLWALQGVIAVFCIMGSVWRFMNYEQAVADLASLAALPQGVWNAIGAFEILCALGLVLPGILRWKPRIIPIAASALTVEMLLISALHINFFGLQLGPENPAMWSLMLAMLSAFVAFGRSKVKPISAKP